MGVDVVCVCGVCGACVCMCGVCVVCVVHVCVCDVSFVGVGLRLPSCVAPL